MNKNIVEKYKKEYHIRNYQHGDFLSILNLWKILGLGNEERGDNEAVIENTISCGGACYLLENSGHECVGTAWITCDGRRLYLHHFGIHPQYQKKHLGSLLLKHVLRNAQKSGIQIKLEVHRENTEAVSLYRNGGFRCLGDYNVYIMRSYEFQ